MVDLLATGHPWSGGGGPITLTPLAGLLVTITLARWCVGLRITPMLFGVSIVLGTIFALVADTWGFTIAISTWVVTALIVDGRIPHTRVTLGRNPSD